MRTLSLMGTGVSLCVAVSVWPAGIWAQGLDIVTQHAEVDLTSPGISIHLNVLIDSPEARTYVDVLTPVAPIQRFELAGQVADVAPHPQYPRQALRATFANPVPAGERIEMNIEMNGTPSCSLSQPRGYVLCVRSPEQTFLFSPIERSWYFFNLYETDAFTGSVDVKVPSGHRVVAGQGAPTETLNHADGSETWRFRFDLPTDALGLYAGTLATVTSTFGRVSATGYFADSAKKRANMEKAVELAPEVFAFYEDMLGPTGIHHVNLMAAPQNVPFGGLGLPGNVFFAEYVFDESDFLVEQGVAHELGHTWWGHVASADYANENEAPFLQEAFAEYSAWRALGALQGDDARTSGVRMNAVWYMYRRPSNQDFAVIGQGVATSPVYLHVTYHKGSVVLRTLEEMVGEEAFNRALRKHLGVGPGALDVAGLESAIREESGKDVQAEVEQWLRKPGFPKIRVTRLPTPNGHGDGDAHTEVRLKFELTGEFVVDVPVRLRAVDGRSTTGKVQLMQGTTEVSLAPSFESALVEVDPRWTMVREVKPTHPGDVTFDGMVDARDLVEVALHVGDSLPNERRVDGRYDPLFDVNNDLRIDDQDLEALRP